MPLTFITLCQASLAQPGGLQSACAGPDAWHAGQRLTDHQDMYPSHPLEIQTHIGIFTWLGFIIDDTNKSIASDLVLFQSRFYTGQAQPTPLLECFAETLRGTYKFWDPVTANFIVLSALAFINANVLETRQEFRSMVLAKVAANWPYHFRNMEGLPEVYTYFMFPKLSHPAIGKYLQAVPDIGKFINLTNDILS